MSPASAANSTLGSTGISAFHNLKSPITYLFGGLAIMLSLIAVALLILACSFHICSPSSASRDKEKPTKIVRNEADDYEPKIVVIMAGDTSPTYLANPVISSSSHTDRTV